MEPHIVVIEPFYGGSHKQLIDVLERNVEGCVKFTLPAKKWHWKARTSALYFAENIPPSDDYKLLFCSSVLNLAELVALRPDLAKLKKVVYFHENQLEYPVRKQQDRDFQYGYNQILTCLVADKVVFNSEYNMSSFLGKINSHLKLIPDHRPKGLAEKIRPKCSVLYFPMNFQSMAGFKESGVGKANQEQNDSEKNTDKAKIGALHDKGVDIFGAEKQFMCEKSEVKHKIPSANHDFKQNATNFNCVPENQDTHEEIKSKRLCLSSTEEKDAEIEHANTPLHIVWPHRWEHDKAPEVFFETLLALKREGFDFSVSVLGETYTDVPETFAKSKVELAEHIVSWGYLPSRENYIQVLRNADVVISTARHEFFGVAMIEAAHLGCYPLCPNRLVYPEIFPKDCIYNTDNQLLKHLKQFCKAPRHLRNRKRNWNLERFSWQLLEDDYKALLS